MSVVIVVVCIDIVVVVFIVAAVVVAIVSVVLIVVLAVFLVVIVAVVVVVVVVTVVVVVAVVVAVVAVVVVVVAVAEEREFDIPRLPQTFLSRRRPPVVKQMDCMEYQITVDIKNQFESVHDRSSSMARPFHSKWVIKVRFLLNFIRLIALGKLMLQNATFGSNETTTPCRLSCQSAGPASPCVLAYTNMIHI